MAVGSLVQVTSGTGPKLSTGPTYTEGGNVVQDPKMIFGEQYLASYSVSLGMSWATSAAHLIQIMAGASLKVRIRRIAIYGTGAVNAEVEFQVRRLTTAGTGGAPITPSPFDLTDSASGATAMSAPTTKGTEGVLLDQGSMGTSTTASPSYAPLVFDYDRPRSKPIIIPAGTANGICIKLVAGVASNAGYVNVYFDETSF